ncbi:hypothetical protein CDS [Bradyrhizobium sp.]|nr:hypothetical protein CDS [Bradyrhizobium sp.]
MLRLLTQIVDEIMCALTCEKLARLVRDIGLTAELRLTVRQSWS